MNYASKKSREIILSQANQSFSFTHASRNDYVKFAEFHKAFYHGNYIGPGQYNPKFFESQKNKYRFQSRGKDCNIYNSKEASISWAELLLHE